MPPQSYQNGGRPPLRIEELGISAEQLARKKTNRRLLFTGISVVLLLVFAVMTFVVMGHQQQQHQLVEENNDSIVFDEYGTTASLSNLDETTNHSVVSTGCETTILLIRHCEKEGDEIFDQDGNEHCSYVGHERAHFLPSLFEKGGGWPVPSLLYARSPKRGEKKHLNFREVETLVPLANKYGLQIRKEFESNDELAKDFFQHVASGEMCGKVALVSWKHDLIGNLARTLACSTCPTSFPDVFDDVWQLKYVYHVKGTEIVKAANNNNGMKSGDDGRQLRKKHHGTKQPKETKKWSLYFSITQQNFDPLKYSFSSGDYDGSASGGKWFTMDEGEM